MSRFSLNQIVKIFWNTVLQNYKLKFLICFALIVFAAFAELLTLSAILPFLSVLANPEMVFNDPRTVWAIDLFDASSAEDLILPFALIFCFAAVLGAAIRLASNYFSIRISFSISHQVGIRIFRNALHRSYAHHISANNNEVLATLTSKLERVIFALILQFFFMITALLIACIILFALIYINPVLTFSVAIVCGLFYCLVILIINKILLLESEVIAQANTKQIKTIRESLGGIRDVFINNAHDFYSSIFQAADYELRRGQAINIFASMSPRFLIESLGLVIIVIAAFYFSRQSSFMEAIPILGALAIGAQKLLPLFQQFYVAWTSLKGNYESLQDVASLLNESSGVSTKLLSNEMMAFHNSIEIRNITFGHDESNQIIFRGLNLHINQGDRIGIIGDSGAGKSTFVDIIAGLLFPSSGGVFIDNIQLTPSNASSWMRLLAYVPQNIFLSDESILENIAIGESKNNIDLSLISSSLESSSLTNFISTLPNGIHTKVGERGMKISGGQRQRIGIARALYKQAKVIIFDEATSALDSFTENEVMDSIYEMDKNITMFVIAHRTSTLKSCNKIIKIENSSIRSIELNDL